MPPLGVAVSEVGDRVLKEMDDAERSAWEALGGYKFFMFGYRAAMWVNLNRISGAKRPNPWRDLVKQARLVAPRAPVVVIAAHPSERAA